MNIRWESMEGIADAVWRSIIDAVDPCDEDLRFRYSPIGKEALELGSVLYRVLESGPYIGLFGPAPLLDDLAAKPYAED